MFLTCSRSHAISQACPSRLAQPAEAGRLLRSLTGAARHGRREVIRERMSSRHCEEPNNADGPPDGASRRKPKAPKGRLLPATGAARATSKPSTRRYGTCRLFEKSGRFRVKTKAANKSSSPGCPWQGRAGRLSLSGNGGPRAPIPRSGPIPSSSSSCTFVSSCLPSKPGGETVEAQAGAVARVQGGGRRTEVRGPAFRRRASLFLREGTKVQGRKGRGWRFTAGLRPSTSSTSSGFGDRDAPSPPAGAPFPTRPPGPSPRPRNGRSGRGG